jgi:hypothetical protein
MLKHTIQIAKTNNLTSEKILSLHDEICFFANTRTNDFYSSFNCVFIKNYMLNNLYERNFDNRSRIEFYDDVIMLVQGEYDYGTFYAHIFGHTEDNILKFMKNKFAWTLGGDRFTIIIVPPCAREMKEYKAVLTYEHHAFLHNMTMDDYVLHAIKHSDNDKEHIEFNFNERDCDLQDWKQIFSTLDKGMIKIYVE